MANLESELKAIEQSLHLDAPTLGSIEAKFRREYAQGLTTLVDDNNRDTFLPMIPTFLHDVPDGTETGTFLALDLGGTNLRICEVSLSGDRKFELRAQKYRVSESLKTGEARALFDYIAQSVDDFLSGNDSGDSAKAGGGGGGVHATEDEQLHLGFTFSFPVEQTALDKGTLINWTKGFKATNAQGRDVVGLLQDALDRKHLHVRCSALVNDTVGTLLARAYQSGGALVGAIFGTGTNGAYVERLENITKIKGKLKNKSKDGQLPEYMIVNTEWGAFDNEREVLRVTPFDNKLDRESINPRKQAFEKMISGMYLGEITRNILLHLIDHLCLFSGHASKPLNTHYGIDTSFMSALEDPSADASALRKVILETLEIPEENLSEADVLAVQRVSIAVGTRAARLSATAIAAVSIQMGLAQPKQKQEGSKKPNGVVGAEGAPRRVEVGSGAQGEVSVGIDGSLAEFYPGFEKRVREALRDLIGDEGEKKIKIGLAKDGSGVGAALCALQAKKQEKSGMGISLKGSLDEDGDSVMTGTTADDDSGFSAFSS